MTVIWNGRESLHNLFVSERDQQLWQTRRNVLGEIAPGSQGLPTCRELRTQTRPRRDLSALQQKRAHAKAKGEMV